MSYGVPVIDRAIEVLKQGGFVLIYDEDGREEETDIVVASQFITPSKIRFMRREGGGLICTTLPYEKAKLIGLPYLHEIFERSGYEIFKYLTAKVRYDKKPSFSITINHRDNFTGIPDKDRAKTIREFAEFLRRIDNLENPTRAFGEEFISPGHVHLLIASDIRERHGHTELSTTLMIMAGLIPSATIVETLGNDDNSLSKEDAKRFAEEHNIPFIEGHEILEAWEKWSE
jgi:3,4-dihydroxy 2-butanone 4-phosphate synthase